MNVKRGNFEFNRYALAITCFFISYLVINSIDFSSLPAPLGDLIWSVPLIFETVVAGVAGLKGSRLFGGIRNFTGRLLFYFSLGIFTAAMFYVYYVIGFLKILTASVYLDVLLADSGFALWILVLSNCFPVYGLLASVSSAWDKYDSKFLVVVLFSLAFALIIGWTNLVFADPLDATTTVADTVLWVGIVPTLAFLELSSAVLLLRSLGRWYVTKSITVLVLAALFSGVLSQLGDSVMYYWLAESHSLGAAIYWSNLMGNFAIFLVCLAITQIKPRMTGPFF